MNDKINNLLNKIEDYQFKSLKYKYSKRNKLKQFLYCLTKENPIIVIRRYLKNIRKVKKLKRYEIKCELNNPAYLPVLNKKIVVYSCIVGNYDIINEPLFFFDNVEYVLFTDQNIKSKNWKIKKIPKKILDLNNNTLINRYIKMHPFEIFNNSDYDYAIYIDGNIKTLTDLSGFIRSINNKTGLAMFRHHSRNCVYIEEKACNIQKLGNKDKIREQISKYKNEGYPKNNGLIECTVFAIDLKNKKAEDILSKWWDEFIKSKSMRDQLSLPYVLWKNNIKIDDIGYLGNNLRWCPKFEINPHKKTIDIEKEDR